MGSTMQTTTLFISSLKTNFFGSATLASLTINYFYTEFLQLDLENNIYYSNDEIYLIHIIPIQGVSNITRKKFNLIWELNPGPPALWTSM